MLKLMSDAKPKCKVCGTDTARVFAQTAKGLLCLPCFKAVR